MITRIKKDPEIFHKWRNEVSEDFGEMSVRQLVSSLQSEPINIHTKTHRWVLTVFTRSLLSSYAFVKNTNNDHPLIGMIQQVNSNINLQRYQHYHRLPIQITTNHSSQVLSFPAQCWSACLLLQSNKKKVKIRTVCHRMTSFPTTRLWKHLESTCYTILVFRKLNLNQKLNTSKP